MVDEIGLLTSLIESLYKELELIKSKLAMIQSDSITLQEENDQLRQIVRRNWK